MDQHGAEGVLLTGVYGSGKSSVAQEIAYLLEQRANRSRCSTWTI
jgi:adenylylsulfate kinase-like enzyme